MAEQVTVLQLVLNRLQLGQSINTIADRIAIQKVISLTQDAGLQLGYSFNWYIRGPYSPSLASDYYQIAADRAIVEGEAARFVLSDSAVLAVDRVRSLFSIPAGVTLDLVSWLELLASVAFLIKRYKLSIEAARQKIQQSKPALYPFFDNAIAVLSGNQFI